MNAVDSLAKASKELMLKEPFYGLFLIALNKVWEKRIPTAGVCKRDINYQLAVNEGFFMGLPEKHRIGLLKHELLHIGFFHLEEQNPGMNRELVNIAMDLEINQYIDQDFLPDGGCTIHNETFAPMNLPPKVGWRAYYDLLLKEQQKQQQSGQGNGALQQLCDGQGSDQAKTDNGDLIPQHGSWKDFEDLSDAEKKLMHSQVEHMLNEISEQIQKTRGTIPGEFAEIINKIKHKEPPRFDWKGYLRRFAGGSQIVYTKKMRRKFNKRFEDNPGLKIKQRRHILVAIDTSGSVSTKELEEFFQEIDHINQTGSDITVIQCDASIRSIKPYKKGDSIHVHGRGGTAFDPVLEYFNENVKKYSCMVYLTDGECYTNVKVRGKMLWVISTRGNINKDLVGPQIKLN
jgi:predicted metal-dependent peptidase